MKKIFTTLINDVLVKDFTDKFWQEIESKKIMVQGLEESPPYDEGIFQLQLEGTNWSVLGQSSIYENSCCVSREGHVIILRVDSEINILKDTNNNAGRVFNLFFRGEWSPLGDGLLKRFESPKDVPFRWKKLSISAEKDLEIRVEVDQTHRTSDGRDTGVISIRLEGVK